MNFGFNNGCVPSKIDIRDWSICSVANPNYPAIFTLDVCRVKNQGGTSSCVAHSCSSVLEYFNQRETGNYLELSTEFIYGYRPKEYYQGRGMCVRDALKTMHKLGDVPVTMMPGNHEVEQARTLVMDQIDETFLAEAYPFHITSYFQLRSTDDIKQALMNYGPVIVNMKWYSKNHIDSNGVYHYTEGDHGNHAVMIYGWNEYGWLVQNSWGTLWGKHGRFIIPFDFKFDEIWGVSDDYIDNGEHQYKKPFSSKLGDFVAKIVNIILHLFHK